MHIPYDCMSICGSKSSFFVTGSRNGVLRIYDSHHLGESVPRLIYREKVHQGSITQVFLFEFYLGRM